MGKEYQRASIIGRIGIITGLFDRKSEYRIRPVACLFDERVERNDDLWLNVTRVCGY